MGKVAGALCRPTNTRGLLLASCLMAGVTPPPRLPALFSNTWKRVRKMGSAPAADVYWVRLTDCKTEIEKVCVGGRAWVG